MEENKNIDNEKLEFTEEGLYKFAEYLTDYPEEQRLGMAKMVGSIFTSI